MSDITDASLIITERRGPGRPRVLEPRSTVSTWIPATAHDRLIEIAKKQDMTVSALVRHWLTFKVSGR